MESSDVLLAAFVAGLRANGYQGQLTSDVRPALEAAIAHGVEESPQSNRSVLEFARFLGRVAPGDAIPEWLVRCFVADLWLVFRCLAGDAEARSTLDGLILAVSQQVARRMRLSEAQAADLRQQVRVETVPCSSSDINRYSGSGSLRGWLRVVATNQMLNYVKRERRIEPLEDVVLDALGGPSQDPELEFLKEHYSRVFRRAFRNAMQDLTAKERNLLHYHVVERVSVKGIARLCGVNRVTVSRWFAAIRHKLLTGTKKRLTEELGLGSTDLESILTLIASRLDYSLGGSASPLEPLR